MHFQNIKIAIRNARKHSVMTTAKLFGLSLSFAVIIFASLYAYYETSFDNHYPDKDKIYRMLMYGMLDGRPIDMAVTTAAMGKAMVDEIPEIKDRNRIKSQGDAVFVINDQTIRAGGYFLTDDNFFDFWGIPIITRRTNALEATDNIVVAKSFALKHFTTVEKALEQTVDLNRKKCVITGVFDDFLATSHLQGKVIRSIKSGNHPENEWGSENIYTYVKSHKPIMDLDTFAFKSTQMVYRHRDSSFDPDTAKTMSDLKFADHTYIYYRAEPLKDIHFGNHRFDNAKTSNKTYVYGAIIFALLVLVISSVNYVNLSLANIMNRHKEIAVRKTNGALQSELIYQFIVETLLFWGLSLVFALVLYYTSSHFLLDYLGLKLELTGGEVTRIVVVIVACLLAFNLLINIAPVTSLSKKSAISLFGNEQGRRKKVVFNNAFVIIQFSISALIILSAILVNKQIDYMLTKDRGYNPENVVMLRLWDLGWNKRKALVEELRNNPNIVSVATSDESFGDDPSMNSCFFEVVEAENYFHTSHMITDPEFIETFDIEMVEGRYFSNNFKNENYKLVVNETVAAEYGTDKSIIGKTIWYGGGDPYEVIGVIKDFNYRSLHHKMAPLVIRRRDNMGNVYIKVNQDKSEYALDLLRQKWKEYNIKNTFQYTFHDEVLASKYEKDRQARKLMLFLSIISIIIACTGLYAISNYTIEQKTKELAIRKINGATVLNIATNVSKKFLLMVALSFVLVIPLSIVLLNRWLDNFAYHTELNVSLYLASLVLLLLISFISIALHVIRAARRNPVEALRYE